MLLLLLLAGCGERAEVAGKGIDAIRPEPVAAAPKLSETAPIGRLDRGRAGSAAPDVAFVGPRGGAVSLADFGGRPLLVNLWATWCAPCVVEMPALDALAAREKGRLAVVAVSQDINGRAAVDGFFAERGFAALEPYLDTEMALMRALGVDTLPVTILYDAQGRELWRMMGMEDWESRHAAALVAEAF